jgi:minor extracellular serine protease Vpr
MMRRPVAIVCFVVLLAALPVAAQGANAVPVRAAVAAWAEIVGDGRATAPVPVDRIVVFNAPAVADGTLGDPAALTNATRAQDNAVAALNRDGIRLDVKQRFLNAINAVDAELSPADVARLQEKPQIRGIYPVRALFPATVVKDNLSGLGTSAKPEALPGGAQTGDDVTVALLDGPVDTTHPYLQHALLPGWDVVTDGPADPTPDPTAARHATAMAGIVAGDGGPDGLQGVAPKAHVRPIQVMSLSHGDLVGTTATLLAGIDRALDPNGDGVLSDRARVILAPVAEPFAAFGESPEAMAAIGAAKVGSVLVAAAGNDGPTFSRFGTVATPGAGAGWIAVGATDGRTGLPQAAVHFQGGALDRTVSAVPLAGALTPASADPMPVSVDAGPTRSDPNRAAAAAASGSAPGDYVTPTGTSLAKGKAVLVARDGGSIAAKAEAAAAAGATALLVYGDGPLPNGALGLDDQAPIPVLALNTTDAGDLAQAATSETGATVSLRSVKAPANPDHTAVVGFSSRGLGFHNLVKPDVTAPGVAVTSALAGGGYAATTGTSTAAAQLAGAAALVAQAHRDWSAAEIRSALVDTAQPAGPSGSTPVEDQGAGVLSVERATSTPIVSDPASIPFGLATGRPFHGEATVSLHNVGAESLSVHLEFLRDGIGDAGTSVTFAADKPTLTIGAGASTDVKLQLTARALPNQSSVVGGWVLVERPGGGVFLRIPWAVATSNDQAVGLIRSMHLAPARIPAVTGTAGPNVGALSRLDLELGAISESGTNQALRISPVTHMTIHLYRGSTLVSRILDAQALLPGVYHYGLTGRDSSGAPLPPGRYRLVVDAVSSDRVTSEMERAFVITKRAGAAAKTTP